MTLVLYNQQLLTIVANGGVPVPEPAGALVMAWLTCGGCGQQYPLRPGATALLVGDHFVQVRPGFVEVCPHCYHQHAPGGRLPMGEK